MALTPLTIKYTAVSLLATVADFAVFSLLVLVSTVYNALATLAGMLVGALISWLLHRYWVFAHSTVRVQAQQLRYAAGIIFTIVLNVGLMAVLADWLVLPRMPSRVVVAIGVWVLLFWFNKKVVFKV
jgi:putative flippase GtrA